MIELIWVTDREPTLEECELDNGEFFVQTVEGKRFSCWYRPFTDKEGKKEEYDNPKWECNSEVMAWMPLPPGLIC